MRLFKGCGAGFSNDGYLNIPKKPQRKRTGNIVPVKHLKKSIPVNIFTSYKS